MLQSVDVGKHRIDAYAASAGADVIDQLRALAKSLQGVRVLHLNATPYGGGVAEILRSEIPLLRDLGLDATWKIITGGEAFFRATKAMHNGLQGSERGLTQIDRETYVANSKANAALLESEYDLYFIHDPQPLGLTEYHGRRDGKWIWRCHIDTARPNAETWAFLRPYVRHYDAAVFTFGGFVPPDIPLECVEIIPPAIDPESPKNMVLKPSTAKRMLQWIGVDPDGPLVAQVSRFDPWKDPLGAIEAYRLAREEIPGLQLAMVGSMALDDPEGCEIYEQVRAATEGDRDIGLHTDLNGVGNMEVNAFQRLADVAIQCPPARGLGSSYPKRCGRTRPWSPGEAAAYRSRCPAVRVARSSIPSRNAPRTSFSWCDTPAVPDSSRGQAGSSCATGSCSRV